MKKFKAKFVFEFEVQGETEEEATREAINCIQLSLENGEVFPNKLTRVKENTKNLRLEINKG